VTPRYRLEEIFAMTIVTSEFSRTRRLMLKSAGVAALIGLGVIPLGVPQALAAANDKYPEDAFKQKNEADAIKALYGKTPEPSDKVKMDAPEIAENGAVVPISATTTLSTSPRSRSWSPRTRSRWWRPTGSRRHAAERRHRIKMAKTSNVTVVVEAGGKLYSAVKEIKVTVGGCGG